VVDNIEVLDCTLRDGGHVNNAEFGRGNILKIETALVKSKVDIIELGFLKDGEFSLDQSNYSRMEDAYENLSHINEKRKFSVMIRPDWYDISQLSPRSGDISLIRFAFYLKDIGLTKKYANIARDLGYDFTLNPVNIMSYTDGDLDFVLKEADELKPYVVNIVDTFGSIQSKDLERIYHFYEKNLSMDIRIGLHLHENMSSAFMLMQHFLEIKNPRRMVVIDGSLLGMGRIPGNLPIEMLLDYMNTYRGHNYDLMPVLEVISNVIEPEKKKRGWGYHPAYYFTGKYQIHRSYAEYYIDNRKDLTLADMLGIFNLLKDDASKRDFSEDRAENYVERYRRGLH
jgi:4-hydroxy 2-oxovalerate aldolase